MSIQILQTGKAVVPMEHVLRSKTTFPNSWLLNEKVIDQKPLDSC
jgi:hypothetical protein